MTPSLPAAQHVRIFSDIHLDCDVTKKFKFEDLWMPEVLPTDKDTVLILAGDLWHAKKPFSYFGQSWMEQISKQFKYVVCVLGNHDLWGGNCPNTYTDFKRKASEQKLDNVFLLQNDTLLMGDIKLVGGTLWTDFMNGDESCMAHAINTMNDYKYTKFGDKFNRLKPVYLLNAFNKTKKYIFDHAVKDYEAQQVWVVTHHAPSFQSLGIQNNTDHPKKYDNALYASDLDAQIQASDISLWVHGHYHRSLSYHIGKCEIVSNPRGYSSELTPYDPWFMRNITPPLLPQENNCDFRSKEDSILPKKPKI